MILVDCELNDDRDPKVSKGKGVTFDFRYDEHYAQFSVNKVSAVNAVKAVVSACADDDLYSETNFYVTMQNGTQACFWFDESGILNKRDDF